MLSFGVAAQAFAAVAFSLGRNELMDHLRPAARQFRQAPRGDSQERFTVAAWAASTRWVRRVFMCCSVGRPWVYTLGAMLVVCLHFPIRADEKPATRTDLYGDPLPDGASIRLGTVRFRTDSDLVREFALSPDGKVLALYTAERIHLYDAATGQHLCVLEDEQKRRGWTVRAFSPDSKLLAADKHGEIGVWQVATGKALYSFLESEKAIPQLVFSPDSERIVSWTRHSGRIRVRDAKTGKLLREHSVPLGDRPWMPLDVSSDTRLVAGATEQDIVGIWDLMTGRELGTLRPPKSASGDLVFGPAGRILASIGKTEVFLQEVPTGATTVIDTARQLNLEFDNSNGDHLSGFAFCPDGRIAAAQNRLTGKVFLWDVVSGKLVRTLQTGHEIDNFHFAPDGKSLVADCLGHLGVWDVATGRERYRIAVEGSNGAYHHHGVAFSADSRLVLAMDGLTVRFWELGTGTEVPKTVGHTGDVMCVRFAPDGRTIFTGGDETVRIWDSATGKQLRCLNLNAARLEVSPDGKKLAIFGHSDEDLVVRVLDVESGREFMKFNQDVHFTGPTPSVQGVTFGHFHGPRTLVFKIPEKPQIGLRDVVTAKDRILVEGADFWTTFALAPDGKTLAFARSFNPSVQEPDYQLIWWDIATNQARRRMQFKGRGAGLLFSPDGRLLACNEGRSIRVLEAATGGEVGRLDLTDDLFRSFVVTPQGRIVALACKSQIGRQAYFDVWDIFEGKKLRRISLTQRKALPRVALSADGTKVAVPLDSEVLIWDLGAPSSATRLESRTNAREPDKLWSDLASRDAAQAYRAVRSLSASPDTALPFLREHLPPIPDEPYAKLVERLNANNFDVRERASKELTELGPKAEPAIRSALQNEQEPEARRRLEALLTRLNADPPPTELLRQIRSVQVLEQVGSPAARQILERLAGGASLATLTREAKEALSRLAEKGT